MICSEISTVKYYDGTACPTQTNLGFLDWVGLVIKEGWFDCGSKISEPARSVRFWVELNSSTQNQTDPCLLLISTGCSVTSSRTSAYVQKEARGVGIFYQNMGSAQFVMRCRCNHVVQRGPSGCFAALHIEYRAYTIYFWLWRSQFSILVTSSSMFGVGHCSSFEGFN